MHDLIVHPKLSEAGPEAGAAQHSRLSVVKDDLLAQSEMRRQTPPQVCQRSSNRGLSFRAALQEKHLGIQPPRQLASHRQVRAEIGDALRLRVIHACRQPQLTPATACEHGVSYSAYRGLGIGRVLHEILAGKSDREVRTEVVRKSQVFPIYFGLIR